MASSRKIDPFTTEHLQSDLKGRSVRGGVATLTSQIVQFAILTTSTVVLAHLLTPRDFGLFAMVTAVTGFGQAFADLGLSEATIQRPNINHEQVTALFWVNVTVGLGLMILTIALSPVMAWFYREPQVRAIAIVVSPVFLICALRVQHDALIKRQMRFTALAIRDAIACSVAVPVAIVMAVHGAGYWAIAALPLVLNTMAMAQSWLIVRWKPGLPRRGAGVRGLISFGGNVAASYLILNTSRSMDNVLIGWYWGAGPLGLYSRAYNLLMIPIRQLNGPAFSVAVPGFSIVQSDRERLARYYLRAVTFLVWIAAPIFGFLFVGATPVILLALGHQWQDAAPVFELLVIGALGQLLLQPTIWLMVSRGESRRLRNLFFVVALIVITSFAVGLPFGIKGVALLGSVVLMLILPWVLKFSFHGTALTLRRLGGVILCPVLVGLAGIAVAKLVLHLWSPPGAALQLVVIGGCFAATYAFALLIPAARNDFATILSVFRNRRSTDAATVGNAG
jgi:O-antigen/teichoic acid export membrane protein